MKWIILHLFLSSMCFSCCLFPLLPPHTHWQPLPSHQMPAQPCKLAAWSYTVLAFSSLRRNSLLSPPLTCVHAHTHTSLKYPEYFSFIYFHTNLLVPQDSAQLRCAGTSGCWAVECHTSLFGASYPWPSFSMTLWQWVVHFKNYYKFMVNRAHVISLVTAEGEDQCLLFFLFWEIITITLLRFQTEGCLLSAAPPPCLTVWVLGWHTFCPRAASTSNRHRWVCMEGQQLHLTNVTLTTVKQPNSLACQGANAAGHLLLH